MIPLMRKNKRAALPVQPVGQIDLRPQHAQNEGRAHCRGFKHIVLQPGGRTQPTAQGKVAEQTVERQCRGTREPDNRCAKNDHLHGIHAARRRGRGQRIAQNGIDGRQAGMYLRLRHHPQIFRNKIQRRSPLRQVEKTEQAEFCRERHRAAQAKGSRAPQHVGIAARCLFQQQPQQEHRRNDVRRSAAHIEQFQKELFHVSPPCARRSGA